jgi:hypothetical protein
MGGFVLQIEGDARRAGQRHAEEMRIGRPVEVSLDGPDGVGHPGAIRARHLHGSILPPSCFSLCGLYKVQLLPLSILYAVCAISALARDVVIETRRERTPLRPGRRWRPPMLDPVLLAAGIALFAVAIGYGSVCERL